MKIESLTPEQVRACRIVAELFRDLEDAAAFRTTDQNIRILVGGEWRVHRELRGESREFPYTLERAAVGHQGLAYWVASEQMLQLIGVAEMQIRCEQSGVAP